MLVSKDEKIKTSSVYTASLILKFFKKTKKTKLSIFEVSNFLKKYDIEHYRQTLFGLIFLYATGLIDFREPYIYLVK